MQRLATRVLTVAIALTGAPLASWAGDSGTLVAAISDWEITEIALDNETLGQVRGEGPGSVLQNAGGEGGVAVILWDEETLGGPANQQSVQVGSLNGGATGSATSVVGN